ncbi:MAG: Uma2 family endonuclease [Ancalomicrobiaceae bacterium]|nr:Uma2 family endonuclease [Ancalomicrobiaceae bacterium]
MAAGQTMSARLFCAPTKAWAQCPVAPMSAVRIAVPPWYSGVMNTPRFQRPDGFAVRLFTVSDLDRMVEAGVIGYDERLELIGGEVRQMSPKGARHEWLKTGLTRYFGKHCPDSVIFTTEAGWHIDKFTYLEPDFLLYSASLRIEEVKSDDALLVIELADTSLSFDLGLKAALYARLGVREYWVIDAVKRETHVHLMPRPDGYAAVRAYDETIRLVPELMRQVPVLLADIPR